MLYRDGLCGKPSVFATNTLVVVYPKSNPGNVKTVFDLRRPGSRSSSRGRACPSATTRAQSSAISASAPAVLANVVSQEPDVRSVLAKVALGEADAGFVYRTDAATLKKQVGVIRHAQRGRSRRFGMAFAS